MWPPLFLLLMPETIVRSIHPTPNVEKGVAYWEGVPATVDGVLGGFGNGTLPRVDALGSRTFLLRTLPYLSSTPPAAYNGTPREWQKERLDQRGGPGKVVTRALDCGAGVGRVSEHSLLPLVDEVHLVEPVHKFLEEAKRASPSWAPLRVSNIESPFQAHKCVYFYTSILQGFPSSDPQSSGCSDIPPTHMDDQQVPLEQAPLYYDVIWCQWCLQHLSEKDMLTFLCDAKQALKPPSDTTGDPFMTCPGGAIIVKENVCRDGEGGTEATWYDEEDYSVTR